MGSKVSTTAETSQTIVNSVLQESTSSCNFECAQSIDGVEITLIGTHVGGDISVTNTCKISNTSCVMKNMLDGQIENVLESLTKINNDVRTSFFDVLTPTQIDNNVKIDQYIRNSISQLISSSCQQKIEQSISNVSIYAAQSTIDGSILVANSGEITNAECMMENITKLLLSNDASADISIDNKVYGTLATLLEGLKGILVPIIIAILLIIGLVFFVALKGAGSVFGGVKSITSMGGLMGGGGK
jgi:hypothetical protein